MIEIIGSGNILPAILFMGIGLFGISIGGILGSIFGGSKTSPGTVSNADLQAEKERQHQILMAKEANELAQLKAVQAEASSKKTLMYVGIGGGVFMMMMLMMMRK